MRRSSPFAPVALGLLGASLWAFASFGVGAQTAQPKPPATPPSVEYVQTTGGYTYKDGVLTLSPIGPATMFFAERPSKVVGHVRNDHFVKTWGEGPHNFKDEPPNATLSVFKPEGWPTQAVFQLTNPRLKGTTLTYDAKLLSGSVPEQGGESSLFIDGRTLPCNSGDDGAGFPGYPCWAQNAFATP